MGDFWEEIPDFGGSTINKRKRKQLMSLYHDWFHGNNTADLNAGGVKELGVEESLEKVFTEEVMGGEYHDGRVDTLDAQGVETEIEAFERRNLVSLTRGGGAKKGLNLKGRVPAPPKAARLPHSPILTSSPSSVAENVLPAIALASPAPKTPAAQGLAKMRSVASAASATAAAATAATAAASPAASLAKLRKVASAASAAVAASHIKSPAASQKKVPERSASAAPLTTSARRRQEFDKYALSPPPFVPPSPSASQKKSIERRKAAAAKFGPDSVMSGFDTGVWAARTVLEQMFAPLGGANTVLTSLAGSPSPVPSKGVALSATDAKLQPQYRGKGYTGAVTADGSPSGRTKEGREFLAKHGFPATHEKRKAARG